MTARFFRITLYVSLLILAYLLPSIALAQSGGFVPLSDANFNKLFNPKAGSLPSIGTFVSNAFRIALSLGAILAVMRIAWAGYQYMTSDAWGEKSHAKEILGDVVIGLLLLMSIWLILNQINPDLLELKLIPPATPAPTGGAATGGVGSGSSPY